MCHTSFSVTVIFTKQLWSQHFRITQKNKSKKKKAHLSGSVRGSPLVRSAACQSASEPLAVHRVRYLLSFFTSFCSRTSGLSLAEGNGVGRVIPEKNILKRFVSSAQVRIWVAV